MSKVAQVEAELEKLSQAELREVRNWLDDMIEDDLEFTPEFESVIQQSEREKAGDFAPAHASLEPPMSAALKTRENC